MPPAGFEPTIPARERPLGSALVPILSRNSWQCSTKPATGSYSIPAYCTSHFISYSSALSYESFITQHIRSCPFCFQASYLIRSIVRFSPYRPRCRVCTGSRSVSRSYHDRFLPNPFQIEISQSVLYILRKRQERKKTHNTTDLLLSTSLFYDLLIFTFLTERL
jgi:hypothetical protein